MSSAKKRNARGASATDDADSKAKREAKAKEPVVEDTSASEEDDEAPAAAPRRQRSADALDAENTKLKEQLAAMYKTHARLPENELKSRVSQQIKVAELTLAEQEVELAQMRSDNRQIAMLSVAFMVLMILIWLLLDLPNPLSALEGLAEQKRALAEGRAPAAAEALHNRR